MKQLAKRVCREWERALFWGCAALISICAAGWLSGLWGPRSETVRGGGPVPAAGSLLNQNTCFRFLENFPEMAPSNPFAFVHKIPVRPPNRTTVREAQPPPVAAGTSAPGKADPTVAAAATTSAGAADTVSAEVAATTSAGAASTAAADPSPPPTPVRRLALTFRGILRGSSGRMVAFVRAVDSARETPIAAPVSPGQSIGDILITGVQSDLVRFRTPDGRDLSAQLGEPCRFEIH